jgi:2-dehydropantoate 2-reductase
LAQQVIGIVGLGPVGSILAAYLARAGVRVVAVETMEERARQVNDEGIRLRGYADLHERIAQCFTSVGELRQVEDLSATFICTKTWAIPSVMKEFSKLSWPSEMRVVAFMNGIGPEDALGAYLPKERICRGVINYAGNLAPDGAVVMNWFHPPNLLGPATDRTVVWAPHIAGILSGAGLGTLQVSHHEIKKAAFYKTILNSALNALCAAHGLTMAEAMRLRHTRGKARVLVQEGLTVAGLVGYHYGEDTLDRCIEYLEAGGEHYPSMWFDLKARRPTEIEYINGKIVKIARMFRHCDVDLNMFFTSAIVTQEIKNGTRAEDDVPDYLIDHE